MKCFLVVNHLNDPIFVDFDLKFAAFINKRAAELGMQEDSQGLGSGHVDAAIIMQIFSPLVLSQFPLATQLQDPCTYIMCPNGLLVVFKKVDDVQYIAINGDETETVEFLQRKIAVFVRLSKFLFGPIYAEACSSPADEKEARWNFLKSLLRTWARLASSDQTFLVEALERLHVNQMVSEKCVQLLERVVQKVQVSSDQPTQHAFLLVNTKLLALYSKRGSFELHPADILLTILLAQDIFPSKDNLDDLMAAVPSYPAHERQHQPRTSVRPSVAATATDGDKSEDGDEEYHSAPATPTDSRCRTPGTEKDAQSSAPQEASSAAVNGVVTSAAALLAGDSNNEDRNRDWGKDESTARHQINAAAVAVVKSANTLLAGDSGEEDKSPDWGKDESRATPEINAAAAAVVKSANALLAGDSDKEDKTLDSGGIDSGDRSEWGDGDTILKTEEMDQKLSPTLLGTKEPPSSLAEEIDAGCPRLSPQSSFITSSAKFMASCSQEERLVQSTSHPAQGKYRNESPPADQSTSVQEEPVITGSRSRRDTEQSTQSRAVMVPDNSTYWPHTVFLQTSYSLYTPHTLHCAQILPGIVLVVILQNSRHNMAESLSQVLGIVQDVMQGRREQLSHSQSVNVYNVISSFLAKVHHSIKKTAGRVKTISSDLQAWWEKEEMKNRFVRFLEQETHFPMSPDLESALIKFQRWLKDLFQQLFLLPPSVSSYSSLIAGRSVMSRMTLYVQEELMDYRDYLSVKAQRNITMTSYLDDFPGLVHFIYVDRHYHQLTAPSLNIISDEGRTDATLFFKEKIWNMFCQMMKKLQEGYTTILMRDGDFYFSYFIWFEDRNGSPLPVQEPYKPPPGVSIPGILTGHFYRRLVRQCFPLIAIDGDPHCHEMFMMHIGLVTPQYVATHCRRLAKKLWEMSGEAFTSVNLL